MPRTRPLATLLPALVVALLVVPVLVAAPGAQDGSEPEAAVDAFHRALRSGDRDAALNALSPEVTVFESGGAELSREEYASHHLGGDMAFSAAVHTEVTERWTGGEGNTAWVLSRTATRGNYRDREINSRGVETMLLRRLDGGWRIVHVHWSSRSAPQP